MKYLIVLLLLIHSLSWSNELVLNCTPQEYKMFDGIIFNENNLTDEDLNTISFIMRINESMNYIELDTSSGFKRKFPIDDEIYKEKIIKKPNFIIECAICKLRNKLDAKKCHNCRVNNAIMSGDLTVQSLQEQLSQYHNTKVKSIVNGLSKDALHGWLNRAQLIIQGLRPMCESFP